tara:strand:+ start:472 stop:1068 length:597 start_codon:yes stop_codon:yes gene_type:complete
MEQNIPLSAVNQVLGAIGQAPVQVLEFRNPEISYIYRILQETTLEVELEGWCFNTEHNYKLTPASDGTISFPVNALQMDVSEGQVWRTTDVVRRQGKLYDKYNQSYVFKSPIRLDFLWFIDYEDIPPAVQNYIVNRSKSKAAQYLIGDSNLVQMMQKDESLSRASLLEYECNQGDYTFFGTPRGTAYRSFQPYQALHR